MCPAATKCTTTTLCKGDAMGLTDRLKDLKGKAEDAVSERSEQIHGAVEKAATVADQRTGGKYSERIQKAGAKADSLVDSLKKDGAAGSEGAATEGGAGEDSAAPSSEGGASSSTP